MKSIFYLVICLSLVLGSCSLSANQETALNMAKTSYINSKNNGTVMSYVAFTLPEVVAFYKNQGDSIFQERFDLSSLDFNDFLTNGNIREIAKKSPEIHVKYEFTNVNIENVASSKVSLFALSENDGATWYFAEENDYFNEDILSPEKRLIKE